MSSALKKSLSDALLAECKDAALQEIGYENFSSEISDSLRKEFSTDFGEYALIMKSYSCDRASAVAKAMGGQLAPLDIDNPDAGFVDRLTGILENKSVSRKLSQTSITDQDPLAWFFDVDKDSKNFSIAWKLDGYSMIDNVDAADLSDKHWFLVEMPIDSGVPDIAPV